MTVTNTEAVAAPGDDPGAVPSLRQCRWCGESKPADRDHFYLKVSGYGESYLERICRECRRAESREYEARKREQEKTSTLGLSEASTGDEPRSLPDVTPLELKVVANAACAGDSRFIEPPFRGSTLRTLRSICESCPVLEECREWGDQFEAEMWPSQRYDKKHFYMATFLAGETPSERGRRREKEKHDRPST